MPYVQASLQASIVYAYQPPAYSGKCSTTDAHGGCPEMASRAVRAGYALGTRTRLGRTVRTYASRGITPGGEPRSTRSRRGLGSAAARGAAGPSARRLALPVSPRIDLPYTRVSQAYISTAALSGARARRRRRCTAGLARVCPWVRGSGALGCRLQWMDYRSCTRTRRLVAAMSRRARVDNI